MNYWHFTFGFIFGSLFVAAIWLIQKFSSINWLAKED